MHRDAALTTAEQSRSPLVAVVALPAVLVPEAAVASAGHMSLGGGGGGGETLITTHMYHDAGDELEVGAGGWGALALLRLQGNHTAASMRAQAPTDCWFASTARPAQVGTSLCHFLTLTATFKPHAGGGHAAEVLLQFGSPEQLAHGGADGQGCTAARDAEAAAAAATEGPAGSPEWPGLAGVEVLGWHLPVEDAVLEVVQRTDTCGGLAVVQRMPLPAEALVGAGPGGARLDLSGLAPALECPFGLRISWASSSDTLAKA